VRVFEIKPHDAGKQGSFNHFRRIGGMRCPPGNILPESVTNAAVLVENALDQFKEHQIRHDQMRDPVLVLKVLCRDSLAMDYSTPQIVEVPSPPCRQTCCVFMAFRVLSRLKEGLFQPSVSECLRQRLAFN